MINRLAVCILVLAAGSALAEELELPFIVDSKKGALLVDAKVQGRPATLLLDTGSSFTILRPEIVGLSSFDMKKSQFAGNGVGLHAQGLWAIAEISLAGRAYKQKVGIVDFDVSPYYAQKVDGLLGQDMLRGFRTVTIDFEAQVIRLRR